MNIIDQKQMQLFRNLGLQNYSLIILTISHFFCSIDTGICIEDIIQTLIDLQIAHTSMSTIDTTYKKQEVRDQRQRRRQKSNSDCDQYDDNNNALNSTSVLSINEDVLHTALTRLSNENRSSKSDQHVFDPNYLRLTSRR